MALWTSPAPRRRRTHPFLRLAGRRLARAARPLAHHLPCWAVAAGRGPPREQAGPPELAKLAERRTPRHGR
eukprot:6199425-Alexandrium_andersonii.AAC.1